MSDTSSAASGGIGFVGSLQLGFIVLKLTNMIDWAWFWILSPFGIIAAVLFIAFVIAVIVNVRKHRRMQRDKIAFSDAGVFREGDEIEVDGVKRTITKIVNDEAELS